MKIRIAATCQLHRTEYHLLVLRIVDEHCIGKAACRRKHGIKLQRIGREGKHAAHGLYLLFFACSTQQRDERHCYKDNMIAFKTH